MSTPTTPSTPDTASGVEHLDLSEVRRLLYEAQAMVHALDNQELPTHADRNRALAGVTKDLLFTAHLLDKTRVGVLDAYQLLRGFTVHVDPR